MNRIHRPAAFLAAALLAAAAHASSPWRVPVRFAITNDAGYGNSWFVVGSHPDLGAWDCLKAVPLAWHDGDVWSADVGVQAGTELEYKFVKRPTNAAEYPDPGNAYWWPEAQDGDDRNLSLSVPAEPPAPTPGKRVVFLCDWPEPVLIRHATMASPDPDSIVGGWRDDPMQKTGPDRYEIDGVGEAGEWMRFVVFHPLDGEPEEKWWWYHFRPADDIEEGDFWTPLDALCVRDGQVFDYEPPAWVSGSRILSTNVYSTADGIAGREIRIYLPRGYDENPSRRYPVVYFSDGQNVFQPGGPFGCWNAETAADREIRAGRMREAILVAVPCRETPVPIPGATADTGRLWEYLPSTDVLMTTDLQGLGAHYADFLVHNVKPTLDYNFRTLPNRENTAHVGSSAGGLLSLYLGTAYGDVFGLVAPMSGVYNEEYIPKFRQWSLEHPDAVAKPKRVWLDTGTEETAVDGLNLYESNWDALTLLLYAGHVPNKSFHFGVYGGWQGDHNEPAWADRLDEVFDFLLPATDEPNPLLPLALSLDGHTLSFPLYGATAWELMRAPDICSPTNAAAVWSTPAPLERPWSNATFTVTQPGFYWLRGH